MNTHNTTCATLRSVRVLNASDEKEVDKKTDNENHLRQK